MKNYIGLDPKKTGNLNSQVACKIYLATKSGMV